ncbi:MAG: glucose 1-dehydrogenase [Steroidobacteraceae bacterium]
MAQLDSKVAIITGAAQGMGSAHARLFVERGAKVILTDVLEAGKSLAQSLGPNAMFIHHDVSEATGWKSVVRQAEARFGTINVLVNNAGILGPIAATTEITEEQYLRVCAVNQVGVFLGMQAVIPSMLRAGGGSIVNVSSISGMVAVYGSPSLAYVASKFAVRGMSKQAAVEYGAKGIRVNSVHPGYIRTPMMVAGTGENGGEAVPQIPLGRIADPVEVSHLVAFLASDEASFISGTEHVIDGAMIAQ